MTTAQQAAAALQPGWLDDEAVRTALLHSLSGFLAATAATCVTYPLDFVKVRYVAQDGTAGRAVDGSVRFRGTVEAVAMCYRRNGLLHMYSGVTAALYASAASWGLYFGLYRYLQARWRGEGGRGRSAGGYGDFASATTAGAVTTTFVNPLWLVKTRMQLQAGVYRSLWHGLRRIVRDEGVRGLATGLGPGMLMVSHGAVQMSIYERLKATAGSDGLSPLQVAGCTVTAKCAAGVVTTPFSVLRTRMQDPRNSLPSVEVRYTGTAQALRTVVKREGVSGLWRGLVPGLVRTVPHAVVTFVSYETISNKLTKI